MFLTKLLHSSHAISYCPNLAAMATERNLSSNSAEPLAIVSLSFKLPQDTVDETSFWEIMEQRRSLATDWPPDRTSLDGFYKEGPKEPNMVYDY